MPGPNSSLPGPWLSPAIALALLPALTSLVSPVAVEASAGGAPSSPPPRSGELAQRGAAAQEGQALQINGRRQQARWLWRPAERSGPAQLWIPLEVLRGQLGIASDSKPDGSIDLEWFGSTLRVPPAGQRSLDDEVALEVSQLLQSAGVRSEPAAGGLLRLELPPPALLRVRTSPPGPVRQVVLDLSGAAVVRQGDDDLLFGLNSTAAQRAELQALGLTVRTGPEGLLIGRSGAPGRVLTLGGPARLVFDLQGSGALSGSDPVAPPPLDPRLQALLNRSVVVERQVRALGSRRMLINSVRLDPRTSPLDLRLLTRADGMEGLSLLPTLARGEQALVAINGGFFNRVRRLPLGALKEEGRWLSGPILNRGAVAWRPGTLPRFGRLALREWLIEGNGRRWPVLAVNSGYVQRGLARYTADWGRGYRALSGSETGVIVGDGLVREQLDSGQLARGVPLTPGQTLVVGRAGVAAAWPVGTPLALSSRPSDPLGDEPFVMGGGPLLLQNGRMVLNGTAEGFSAAFQRQGAPRTVIGSDGRQLWLVTLQGVEHPGPTLSETAALLGQLGLRDALNLDGGSSTGLMVGTAVTVNGRGVAASIHNGLGLVPRDGRAAAALPE